MYICIHVCVSIYGYIIVKVFANGPVDLGSIQG